MQIFSTSLDGDSIRRRGRSLTAVAFMIAGLTAASAQEEEKPADQKTRQASSMRESIYKELARAQEVAEENDFAEALRLLNNLSDEELSSYERTQLWNLYAFVYHAQERYPEAIDAFKKLLNEEELDEALEARAVYTLAMLHFATEDWRHAIDMINRWSSLTSAPTSQVYELLAEAHYQLKEYRKAIPPLRKTIELKRAEGQPVDERSYLLLRSAYVALREYDQVAGVLEELIRHFPGDKYWIQLAGAYAEAGEGRKQLNALELAYLQGYLDTQPELLMLAGLLLGNDLPYRAGKVLEKGLEEGVVESTLENWRLLSQAWTLAHEDRRAIPALTRATRMSKDGELDMVLAQSHLNLEQWEAAAECARTGIEKSGLRRPDQAHVMLGQILFYMNAFEDSRGAFEQAQADSRSRKLAAQWLSYIDKEEDRQAQLKAALQE